MTIPFSAMITYDGTISFTHTDGRIYNILQGHPLYERAIELVRELSNPPADGLPFQDDLRIELYEISQPRKLIARSSDNRILVEGDQVTFDGKPVEQVIAKRLLWMVEQGFDAEPLFKFLVLLSENPSYRAAQCLYAFMDAAKMAITPEGKILAYKRVTSDYRDIRTKTFDNSIGQRVTMTRNEVNEDPNMTCSAGLHVCSFTYLPHYGCGDGNKVVVCEIHPKDVVAVPTDYNNAKMRVCEYLVVGEVEDTSDILGSKAVMSFVTHDDDDDDDDDDEDYLIESEDDEDIEYELQTIFDDALMDYVDDVSDVIGDKLSLHLGIYKAEEFLNTIQDAASDEDFIVTESFLKIANSVKDDSDLDYTFGQISEEFLKSTRR